MKKRLMAEQWTLFEKIISKDAPAIQRKEMKRAFYAGAQCILFRVIQAFAPETEPTAEDIQIMEDVHQELQEFAQQVQRGEA